MDPSSSSNSASSAAASSPGKGAGKVGKGPPQPVKGKASSKGAGSANAGPLPPLPKGGKAPSPQMVDAYGRAWMPPAGKGEQKGKGKLPQRNVLIGIPPPNHLTAPPESRPLHYAASLSRSSPEGTIWEGLGPWDSSGADVLEGCSINAELMLSQFENRAPVAAEAPFRQVRQGAFSANIAQNFSIIVRSKRLDADLVLRALSTDLDLLTLDQAIALQYLIPDAEHVGALTSFITEHGADAMDTMESVLWAIHEAPHGRLLVTFAHTRAMLQMGDFQEQCDHAEGVRSQVDTLDTSRALRTVFQIALVAINTSVQMGFSSLMMRPFCDILDTSGTMGEVIAEHIEATHATRCRLRFMRLLNVGKCPVCPHHKRMIWSYLDDLQESVWVAVPQLLCFANLGVDGLDEQIQSEHRVFDRQLRQLNQFQTTQAGQLPSLQLNQRVFLQLSALQDALSDAKKVCIKAKDSLDTSLSRLRTMTGCADHNLALHCLSRFGRKLESQMRRQHTTGGGARRLRWGVYPVVDTAHYIANLTSDLDLIRNIRAPPSDNANQAEDAARVRRPSPTPKEMPGTNGDLLMHGGPEGEYRRHPETGRWMPLGMMALIRPDVPQSGRIPGL